MARSRAGSRAGRRARLAALALAAVALAGAGVARSAPITRGFAFTPASDVRVFAVMEGGYDFVSAPDQDFLDRAMFTNSLGFMVNSRAGVAGGLSADARHARGHLRLLPTARVRAWLPKEQALDLRASSLAIENGNSGVDLLLEARYAPAPVAYVEVGAFRFRTAGDGKLDPDGVFRYENRARWYGYAGLGLQGPPGAAMLGCEVLMGLLVLAAFAALEGVSG